MQFQLPKNLHIPALLFAIIFYLNSCQSSNNGGGPEAMSDEGEVRQMSLDVLVKNDGWLGVAEW